MHSSSLVQGTAVKRKDVLSLAVFMLTFSVIQLVLIQSRLPNAVPTTENPQLTTVELKKLSEAYPEVFGTALERFKDQVGEQDDLKFGARSLFSKSMRNEDGVVDFPDLLSFPFFNETVKDFKRRIKKRIRFSQLENSPSRGKIFVSVPAYRDSICPSTLKNMYEKAADPSRIFVGLCDQMDFEKDEPCKPPPQYQKQVRSVRMQHYLSRGPTLARYVVSKLWDGEEFFFMIDAHTDFIQDWDAILVNMMRNHHKKAIVTHYPVGENRLLGRNEYNHLPWICKAKFNAGAPEGLFMQECEDCRPENRPGNITCPSVFLGAGFTLGSAEMIYDAPYDRYLEWFFQGEEVLMASRLWTAGWEMYSPTTNVISHVYGFRNHSVFSEVKKQRSDAGTMNRARYLLGFKNKKIENGVEVIVPEPYPVGHDEELEDLGMGMVRTIEEYLEFAGIDWANHQHTHRCKMRYDWELKKWFPAK